jgi:hypothetical protein
MRSFQPPFSGLCLGYGGYLPQNCAREDKSRADLRNNTIPSGKGFEGGEDVKRGSRGQEGKGWEGEIRIEGKYGGFY